eukprot:TRINITY_DN33012_c0_g1_i1.p1 TRINITY_DN33012_c0_g1~~TRINITY_DN33012_c0_g1_i1.p1  ORF type:complete len:318 (+),score=67.92 TRINITY_DN33012_c0_g1_i1:60-1013(+)
MGCCASHDGPAKAKDPPRPVTHPPSKRRIIYEPAKGVRPPPRPRERAASRLAASMSLEDCDTLNSSYVTGGTLNESFRSAGSLGRRARGSGAGMLSPFEVDMFHELVKCRKDPKGYASYVMNMLEEAVVDDGDDPEGGGAYFVAPDVTTVDPDASDWLPLPAALPLARYPLAEGRAAYEDCLRFLLYEAKPVEKAPYSVSAALQRAAAAHREDCSRHNLTGHVGSAKTTLDERICKHGAWKVGIAENLCYGAAAPRDAVIRMLVDDGVANRRRRNTIFNEHMAYLGISCGGHPSEGSQCVVVFAGSIDEPPEKVHQE